MIKTTETRPGFMVFYEGWEVAMLRVFFYSALFPVTGVTPVPADFSQPFLFSLAQSAPAVESAWVIPSRIQTAENRA